MVMVNDIIVHGHAVTQSKPLCSIRVIHRWSTGAQEVAKTGQNYTLERLLFSTTPSLHL